MTKLRAVALVALALVAGACTTKENTNTTTTTPPPADVFTDTYTLQGFVADATNGARIGGSDLQLFLVQGTTIRTPTRLNSGATDPLLGEYAFAGIPLDYNDTNKTYKVVAVKPGYQRFEAEISNQAVVNGAPVQFDTVYNLIGNIYMFPTGATTPAYQFTALYNGKPVPNATVVLDPAPNANNPLYNTGHALTSSTGYLASLSATTDANGVATFPGANLVLGGAYQVQVLPVAFTDSAGTTVQLQRFDGGANFVAGLANVVQTILLSDLVPDNLYVVNASNQALGSVNATGSLVITFNAPVILRTTATGFGATSNSPSGVFGTSPVSASLSADGRVLTLAPVFTTAPTEANNVLIQYSNGGAFVEAADYPGVVRSVFGGGVNPLQFAGGGNVNPTVTMRAP